MVGASSPQTTRRDCVCYSKKNTYAHESLILNANTVTCKHVFQLNFIAVCSSPSGQLAFAYIKAHPSFAFACNKHCQSEKEDHALLMAKQNKSSSEGKQHTRPVADQTYPLCVSVALNVCVFMFTTASAHFTWH